MPGGVVEHLLIVGPLDKLVAQVVEGVQQSTLLAWLKNELWWCCCVQLDKFCWPASGQWSDSSVYAEVSCGCCKVLVGYGLKPGWC